MGSTGDNPTRALTLAAAGTVDVSPGLWHDAVELLPDLRSPTS